MLVLRCGELVIYNVSCVSTVSDYVLFGVLQALTDADLQYTKEGPYGQLNVMISSLTLIYILP